MRVFFRSREGCSFSFSVSFFMEPLLFQGIVIDFDCRAFQGRAGPRAMGNSCVTGCGRSNQGQRQKDIYQKLIQTPSPVAQMTSEALQATSEALQTTSYSESRKTTFKWTIDGFSSLLDKGEGWTFSGVFQIWGLNWYLKLNLRVTKSGDKEEYVSLKLELAQPCVRSGTVLEVSFKFLIYDQSYGKHHEQHQVSHNFQSTSTTSETSCMIPLTTLKEKSSIFFVNNCCVFGVEFIRVADTKSNDVSETLFVQKIDNTFSDPQVYSWNIDDFFVLKNPSTSPEFELCEHKWFITIYPSGSKNSGNYLSLSLCMKVPETLHENSGNLVEVSISIKSQETIKHRKLSGRCQFSKNSSRWGFNRFISLEDFKDPSNGYLVKTKCCIEAQVAVIGSSKME